jgi:hypothetical protein
MMELAEMQPYTLDYQAAFDGRKLPEALPVKAGNKVLPLFAAAAASAVVGFAVDYVQKGLQEEATLYEAQFGTTIASDQFWIFGTNQPGSDDTSIKSSVTTTKTERRIVGTNEEPTTVTTTTVLEDKTQSTYFQRYVQNYYGFRITRGVPGTTKAFELVCGIAPSYDQQVFRVAPLYFRTVKSKAKILGDVWWTYVLPWTIPSKFFKKDGHHIDTKVDIDIDGYWKDKDQQLKVAKLATIPLTFQSYDISKSIPLTASGSWTEGGKSVTAGEIKGTASGWLLSVPFSLDPTGKPVSVGTAPYAGALTLKVVVTEKDPSNAKQGLEQLAQIVGQQKQPIIDKISK